MLIDYDTVVIGGVPWRIPRSPGLYSNGSGRSVGLPRVEAIPDRTSKPKPSRRYRHFKFGPLELKLYRFLDSRAATAKPGGPCPEQPLLRVIEHIYGKPKDARDLARKRNRLQQLRRGVNGKLNKAEDPRRIFSPKSRYVALSVPTSPRPRPATTAASQRQARKLARERVPRPWQICQRFLQVCLGRGIARAKELERLCMEDGNSRRSYFRARRELQLQSVRRRDAKGYYWELLPPEPEPEAKSQISHSPQVDTLRPDAAESPPAT